MFNLIVFGVIALALLVLGYQIRYKKKATLISGFNEDLVTDVNGLCNYVGGLMIINAVIALSTGILMAWLPSKLTYILIYFVIGMVVTSVLAITGTRKFKTK